MTGSERTASLAAGGLDCPTAPRPPVPNLASRLALPDYWSLITDYCSLPTDHRLARGPAVPVFLPPFFCPPDQTSGFQHFSLPSGPDHCLLMTDYRSLIAPVVPRRPGHRRAGEWSTNGRHSNARSPGLASDFWSLPRHSEYDIIIDTVSGLRLRLPRA